MSVEVYTLRIRYSSFILLTVHDILIPVMLHTSYY